MRCETARLALSRRLDGDLGRDELPALDEHVRGCERCQTFATGIAGVRQQLRVQPLRETTDLTARVMARVAQTAATPTPAHGRTPRRYMPAAAALVAGAVAGATLVLGRDPAGDVAAADVGPRVVAAQASVEVFHADLDLVERGWHPLVPERRFRGHVDFTAPESLWLHLEDTTQYPSTEWVPNDVDRVVADGVSWSRGPRECPTPALPDCTPPDPRAVATTRPEPFSGGSPIALELVTPVASFALSPALATLEARSVGGRSATGVAVTAAQAAPLLDSLHPAGNLRSVHPSDRVEIWLDDDTLAPLHLRVLAAPGDERARWAAARGYVDEPGDAVLELTMTGVDTTNARADVPPAPGDAVVTDAGFADSNAYPAFAPRVPPGFTEHRTGFLAQPGAPEVAVRTWTDGREWIKVRFTRGWTGTRLFGDVGDLVLERPLPSAGGVAYTNGNGTAVAVHGAGVDLAVSGSAPTRVLLDVAGSLGIAGQRVPAGWTEAATVSVAEAARAVPGLLVPPPSDGFAAPAARLDGNDRATVAYTGPGQRAFVLSASPAGALLPPLDPDARGLAVRGVNARYSPARGELEWTEDGLAFSLRSATLPLAELVAIAASLEPA